MVDWKAESRFTDVDFPKEKRKALVYIQRADYRPAWEIVVNLTHIPGDVESKKILRLAEKAIRKFSESFK